MVCIIRFTIYLKLMSSFIVVMMGRIIISRDCVHTVSINGITPGVYVLRLINGDDVKTQKMVLP